MTVSGAWYSFSICKTFFLDFFLQSSLCKKTTFGITQKWSSWTVDRLITQTKSGRSRQVFSFYSHCDCFINNKDLLE